MQKQTDIPRNNILHSGEITKRQQEPKPAKKPFWKVVRIRAPSLVMPFPGLWPDGMLRWAPPETIRRAELETLSILETLMALNRTGLYTAFFQFHAYVGCLSIDIFEGRWNGSKKPIRIIEIDCRRYPLIDTDTQKPFYAQQFLNELILLVQ